MGKMLRPAIALVLLLLFGPAGRPGAQGPTVEDRFDVTTCDVLETNGEACGRVRFGWADCPGQRGVPCDVCYSPSGKPFAYVKRTNKSYRLSSGCERLEDMPAEDVYLIAWDPDDAERWESAGVVCAERGRELICQKPLGPPAPPKPREPPPEQTAAQEIQRQWKEGKRPKASFSYAGVPFGPKGRTLHAVQVTGSFEVAYDPQGKTVADFVTSRGAAGGVTGTFFGRDGPAGPVLSGKDKARQVVARRTVKSVKDPKSGKSKPVYVPRTFLGSDGNGFFLRDLPVDLDLFNQELAELKEDPELQGLGGTGRLLRAGTDVHATEARQVQRLDSQAGDFPDARVVAGIAGAGKSSRLILLVQEGDDTLKTGAGIDDLGKVLLQLGATEAVILDGGGSAQIYIPSLEPRIRYNGDGRVQPTAILFR